MNRTGYFLFLGLTFTTGALLTAATGCGTSTGSGTGGETGGAASTGTKASSSSSGTGGTTTASSTGTMGTGGSTVSLDCATYCGEVMTNCTTTNAQYTSMDICMGYCAGFPVGTLADMSGDTLGCRIYHAGAPAVTNPTLHCPHAGPTGGDESPTGTAGTCGEPCDAFCNVAAAVCTGANQQFATMAACTTACKSFKADMVDYNDTDTANNDMGCRFYHLSAASAGATAAMTHCPHIVVQSAVCTM